MPKIDSNKIDDIIEWILEGKTYREIASELDVKLTTLHDFCSKSEHSARVREAFVISADSFADLAEQVLKMAEANLIEISRARELAQLYKWKAKMRNPKKYSDKVDVTSNGEKIETTFIKWGDKEIGV